MGTRASPRSQTARGIPQTDFNTLLAQVSAGDFFHEGVVVACYDAHGVKLVKMKAAEYLRMHSQLSECTRSKVFILLEHAGATTLDLGRKALIQDGFDWELVSFAADWITEYVRRHNVVVEVHDYIAAIIASLGDADRKSQAIAMREACSGERARFFSMAMAMCSGHNVSNFMGAYRCNTSVSGYQAMMQIGGGDGNAN